jgi:CheY-like chemotaxis protein
MRHHGPVAATVLVVDDQDFVRDVVKLALEAAGFRVLETSSPKEAVALAREWRDDIEVLVTDVVMPEMDAFELAEQVRHEIPKVRVLYTSGYADARAEGAFLAKPFTPSELVEQVRSLLSSR